MTSFSFCSSSDVVLEGLGKFHQVMTAAASHVHEQGGLSVEGSSKKPLADRVPLDPGRTAAAVSLEIGLGAVAERAIARLLQPREQFLALAGKSGLQHAVLGIRGVLVAVLLEPGRRVAAGMLRSKLVVVNKIIIGLLKGRAYMKLTMPAVVR